MFPIVSLCNIVLGDDDYDFSLRLTNTVREVQSCVEDPTRGQSQNNMQDSEILKVKPGNWPENSGVFSRVARLAWERTVEKQRGKYRRRVLPSECSTPFRRLKRESSSEQACLETVELVAGCEASGSVGEEDDFFEHNATQYPACIVVQREETLNMEECKKKTLGTNEVVKGVDSPFLDVSPTINQLFNVPKTFCNDLVEFWHRRNAAADTAQKMGTKSDTPHPKVAFSNVRYKDANETITCEGDIGWGGKAAEDTVDSYSQLCESVINPVVECSLAQEIACARLRKLTDVWRDSVSTGIIQISPANALIRTIYYRAALVFLSSMQGSGADCFPTFCGLIKPLKASFGNRLENCSKKHFASASEAHDDVIGEGAMQMFLGQVQGIISTSRVLQVWDSADDTVRRELKVDGASLSAALGGERGGFSVIVKAALAAYEDIEISAPVAVAPRHMISSEEFIDSIPDSLLACCDCAITNAAVLLTLRSAFEVYRGRAKALQRESVTPLAMAPSDRMEGVFSPVGNQKNILDITGTSRRVVKFAQIEKTVKSPTNKLPPLPDHPKDFFHNLLTKHKVFVDGLRFLTLRHDHSLSSPLIAQLVFSLLDRHEHRSVFLHGSAVLTGVELLQSDTVGGSLKNLNQGVAVECGQTLHPHVLHALLPVWYWAAGYAPSSYPPHNTEKLERRRAHNTPVWRLEEQIVRERQFPELSRRRARASKLLLNSSNVPENLWENFLNTVKGAASECQARFEESVEAPANETESCEVTTSAVRLLATPLTPFLLCGIDDRTEFCDFGGEAKVAPNPADETTRSVKTASVAAKEIRDGEDLCGTGLLFDLLCKLVQIAKDRFSPGVFSFDIGISASVVAYYGDSEKSHTCSSQSSNCSLGGGEKSEGDFPSLITPASGTVIDLLASVALFGGQPAAAYKGCCDASPRSLCADRRESEMRGFAPLMPSSASADVGRTPLIFANYVNSSSLASQRDDDQWLPPLAPSTLATSAPLGEEYDNSKLCQPSGYREALLNPNSYANLIEYLQNDLGIRLSTRVVDAKESCSDNAVPRLTVLTFSAALLEREDVRRLVQTIATRWAQETEPENVKFARSGGEIHPTIRRASRSRSGLHITLIVTLHCASSVTGDEAVMDTSGYATELSKEFNSDLSNSKTKNAQNLNDKLRSANFSNVNCKVLSGDNQASRKIDLRPKISSLRLTAIGENSPCVQRTLCALNLSAMHETQRMWSHLETVMGFNTCTKESSASANSKIHTLDELLDVSSKAAVSVETPVASPNLSNFRFLQEEEVNLEEHEWTAADASFTRAILQDLLCPFPRLSVLSFLIRSPSALRPTPAARGRARSPRGSAVTLYWDPAFALLMLRDVRIVSTQRARQGPRATLVRLPSVGDARIIFRYEALTKRIIKEFDETVQKNKTVQLILLIGMHRDLFEFNLQHVSSSQRLQGRTAIVATKNRDRNYATLAEERTQLQLFSLAHSLCSCVQPMIFIETRSLRELPTHGLFNLGTARNGLALPPHRLWSKLAASPLKIPPQVVTSIEGGAPEVITAAAFFEHGIERARDTIAGLQVRISRALLHFSKLKGNILSKAKELRRLLAAWPGERGTKATPGASVAAMHEAAMLVAALHSPAERNKGGEDDEVDVQHRNEMSRIHYKSVADTVSDEEGDASETETEFQMERALRVERDAIGYLKVHREVLSKRFLQLSAQVLALRERLRSELEANGPGARENARIRSAAAVQNARLILSRFSSSSSAKCGTEHITASPHYISRQGARSAASATRTFSFAESSSRLPSSGCLPSSGFSLMPRADVFEMPTHDGTITLPACDLVPLREAMRRLEVVRMQSGIAHQQRSAARARTRSALQRLLNTCQAHEDEARAFVMSKQPDARADAILALVGLAKEKGTATQLAAEREFMHIITTVA